MWVPRSARLVALVAVALAGCSSPKATDADAATDAVDPHAVRASDYDRACLRDSDCILVTEGTVGCCGFGCPNAAIASSAQAAYQADVVARATVCNPRLYCPSLQGVDLCGDPAATCVDSVCEMLTCEKNGCPRGAFCHQQSGPSSWECAPIPMACAVDASSDVADVCTCLTQQVFENGACSQGSVSCTTPGGTFLVTCTAEARD
jgi:hypothetical protein